MARADLARVTLLAKDTLPSLIRSFCIVAHVDHGKTTLSDRLLEKCGNIAMLKPGKELHTHTLDSLDVERARGITVKARHASMAWRQHLLQLVDTPGHVDFADEVSRSVAAVDAAVLLVDSSQGVQAQTLAVAKVSTFMYLAYINLSVQIVKSYGLSLLPVLTKCDLPHALPERVMTQVRTNNQSIYMNYNGSTRWSPYWGSTLKQLFIHRQRLAKALNTYLIVL
jgi:small GTP-binding protein